MNDHTSCISPAPRIAWVRTPQRNLMKRRDWIRDEDPDYGGCYSGDEYYSTENKVDKVVHARKNVPGEDGS
jgi:hypothetical protein